MLALTEANYHSPAANMEYMSCSSYKNYLECEAMALASDRGEYKRLQTPECLVGSYIHAWNESPAALEQFKANTPEMFSSKGPTKGDLKANFLFANQMISALADDAMCSYMLEGEKEVIMTAEMFGAPWKIKIDTYKPDDSIVDLKTTRSIWELAWNDYYKCRMSFIENYQYFTQFAIYLEVERIAQGRTNYLTPYIVAVSKEAPPDKAVISLDDPMRLNRELMQIAANLPRILQVKSGEVEPVHCGRCSYCRSIKKVTDIISYRDLEAEKEAV